MTNVQILTNQLINIGSVYTKQSVCDDASNTTPNKLQCFRPVHLHQASVVFNENSSRVELGAWCKLALKSMSDSAPTANDAVSYKVRELLVKQVSGRGLAQSKKGHH